MKTRKQVTLSEVKQMFNDYIDETNEMVKIFDIDYAPSEVFEIVDEIAYRSYLMDFYNDISNEYVCDELE
jgi:hypothetical protein